MTPSHFAQLHLPGPETYPQMAERGPFYQLLAWLYREGGYQSLTEWAEGEHRLSRFTLTKAMAIAQHFSADMAERFGTEKLVSTYRYLQATRREEEAGDALALTFPVQRNGRFASVPFAEATYREIDSSRRRLVASQRSGGEPVPRTLTERVKDLTAALPPAPKGSRRGERVRVERARDGRSMFSFSAIPEEDLPAFIEALRAHLLGSGA